jgi:peptide/nickel transport system permease protein
VISYLIQRLLHGLLVLWGVSLIVFALSYLGGDPARALLPLDTAPEDVEAFRHAAGFDQPLPIQYARFVGRALGGDFGQSLRYREPVMPLVLARLPLTLALALAGMGVALGAGIPLGIVSAWRPDSALDWLARALMLLSQSLPNFWLATVLILVFAVSLRWLPPSGLDDVRGLILPALTVGALPAATIARVLRANLRDVLRQEYVRTARAKGLHESRVLMQHALRNVLIPLTTIAGLQLGTLLGGSIIAEAVFALPGLGRLSLLAISARDVPLIQAFVLVSATFIVLINLALDLVYTRLDPRVRSL